MADLFTNLTTLKPAEIREHSREALNWFRQQIRNVYKPMTRDNLLQEGTKSSRIIEGNMYMMFYDAKTKSKLAYWDRFPLVIPFDTSPANGFYGLNLHYIAPRYRVELLHELYKMKNKDEGVFIEYTYLQKVSRLKFAKPCIKRYLNGHITRKPMKIDLEYWDVAAMLPTAYFKDTNANTVYAESRKQF